MPEKLCRLPLHPSRIRLERCRGNEHLASSQVNEGHGENLTWSVFCPNPFAEEIDLPQGVGVEFDKLAPTSTASLGARFDVMFYQDVLDRLSRDLADAKLPQLTEDTAIAPTGFIGDLDHQLTNNASQARSSLSRFRIGRAFITNPASEGRLVDSRNDLANPRAEFLAQLQQPSSFIPFQEDSLPREPSSVATRSLP